MASSGWSKWTTLFWFSNWRVTWNVDALCSPQFYPSLSQSLKKTQGPKDKEGKEVQPAEADTLLVWAFSMNAVNLFRKRERIAERGKMKKRNKRCPFLTSSAKLQKSIYEMKMKENKQGWQGLWRALHQDTFISEKVGHSVLTSRMDRPTAVVPTLAVL